MKVGFIGAGKVGNSFGLFVKKRGLDVSGYVSRSVESAMEAAVQTDSAVLSMQDVIEQSTYLFITTPDDQIETVWKDMQRFSLQGKKIFHMSGCLSSSVFRGSGESGALCYALHPLYSFADKERSDLSEVVFSLEGYHIDNIRNFLTQLNIHYFILDKEKKPLYHASAVFVSNYVVALAKIAEDFLVHCGLDKELAVKGMIPLMESALLNIKTKGVNESLTGPIIRGDADTIQQHLKQLPAYQEIYKKLGLVALQIGSETGKLPDSKVEELDRLLRSE